jgi:vacuolar-type H+-ATPase subunit E/Vma4
VALEKLIEVLRQGTEAEAAAILTAARTEADAIRARTEAEVAERRGREQAAREAERASAIELALTTGRRTARREELEARQRVLDRVFAAAAAEFGAALERPEYRAALQALVTEAVGCLGGREGTLRCHPTLQRDLKRIVGSRPALRVVGDPATGSGFKLLSDDGAVEIDGTLEDRLVRRATRLAVEVAARLEAES